MKILDQEFHRRWRNSSPASLIKTTLPSISSSGDMNSVLSFTRRSSSPEATMSIRLSNHYSSKVYSSRSRVSGQLVITPPGDVAFDHVAVLLVGAAKTRTDVAQVVQSASHTFLRLEMPIDESAYPTPRMFEAGGTYTVPFDFVIPEHLTVSACRHRNVSEDVAHQHVRPPPSMGSWEKDDLSPVMARVEYSVIAIIYDQPETASSRPAILMETSQRINVLPASVEDPPLNVTARDRGYALEKSTNIRKHLFAGKKGRITASASQPAPIRVKADGTASSDVSVVVKLSFDASSSSDVPPEVSQVSAKLQAATWFTRLPLGNLPNIGANQAAITGIAHMNYSTSLALSNTEMRKTSWKCRKLCPGSLTSLAVSEERRQSESAIQPSQPSAENADPTPRRRSEGGLPTSLSSLLQLSLQIPTSRRLLLPTFHSCLVSRTYTLYLNLVMGDAKINLAVPVQVVVEPPPESQLASPGLPTFEDALAAQEEADADELLRPRIMTPPARGARGGDVLPGYE